MKKLILFSLTILLSSILFAQAPQLLSYQAVARNGAAVLAGQSVGLQFTIRDVNTSGNIVYQETQTLQTNAHGLFTHNIGSGTVVNGTFATIDWNNGKKYLQVEIDPTGGTNYQSLGTTQLVSVPYALNSGNGVPTGTVISYAGPNPPAGYLICDGSAVDRTTYPSLFAAIGTAWGNANNNPQKFNLPDLQGRFLRGLDSRTTGGNDPDNTTRTAILPGGNTGSNVGSLQGDEFKSHSHNISTQAANGGISLNNFIPKNDASNQGTWNKNTSASGGSETRPINAYVYYIIKY